MNKKGNRKTPCGLFMHPSVGFESAKVGTIGTHSSAKKSIAHDIYTKGAMFMEKVPVGKTMPLLVLGQPVILQKVKVRGRVGFKVIQQGLTKKVV
jgi:hypothetical protein